MLPQLLVPIWFQCFVGSRGTLCFGFGSLYAFSVPEATQRSPKPFLPAIQHLLTVYIFWTPLKIRLAEIPELGSCDYVTFT